MHSSKPLRSLTLISEVQTAVLALKGGEPDFQLQSEVEARVKARYQDLGFHSLQEYGVYFDVHEKDEQQELIEKLTVVQSGFFSEVNHFEMILQRLLPEVLPEVKNRKDKRLRIWVAGCGRGQEAISLLLYLKYHLRTHEPDLKVSILGTDENSVYIDAAITGFYPRSEIRQIPLELMGNDWKRSSQSHVEGMKFESEQSEAIAYKVMDLEQVKLESEVSKFDFIFCRNHLSGLNESQISENVTKLIACLHPHGNLFIGLKESLAGLGLPVVERGPAIYGLAAQQQPSSTPSSPSILESFNQSSEMLRIFCLDDSPAVATLIKQMIKSEWGLEIVGSATSLDEAQTRLEEIKKSDLLIVHLNFVVPALLAYLESNCRDNHPPIVFLSNEQRQSEEWFGRDSRIASFELMEPPVLNQLNAQGDALRARIRTLMFQKASRARPIKVFDPFKRSRVMTRPDQKVRVLVAGTSDLQKIAETLRELSGVQPPLYLFFDGVESNLEEIAQEIKFLTSKACSSHLELTEKLQPSQISVLDTKRNFLKVANFHTGQLASIAVMGDVSTAVSQLILKWPEAQLILEDLGLGHGANLLDAQTSEVYVTSSFAYLGSEYLEKK